VGGRGANPWVRGFRDPRYFWGGAAFVRKNSDRENQTGKLKNGQGPLDLSPATALRSAPSAVLTRHRGDVFFLAGPFADDYEGRRFAKKDRPAPGS